MPVVFARAEKALLSGLSAPGAVIGLERGVRSFVWGEVAANLPADAGDNEDAQATVGASRIGVACVGVAARRLLKL